MREIKSFQVAVRSEMKSTKLSPEKARRLWKKIMMRLRKQRQ